MVPCALTVDGVYKKLLSPGQVNRMVGVVLARSLPRAARTYYDYTLTSTNPARLIIRQLYTVRLTSRITEGLYTYNIFNAGGQLSTYSPRGLSP